MSWISRIWRRRGHGVHSTFAYRFIREVLTEPYAYYAYSQLATHQERLIYRLAVFAQPQRIESLGKADVASVKKAFGKANAQPPRWACLEAMDMVVASGSASKSEIANAIKHGRLIVLLHANEQWLAEFDLSSRAVFSNGSGLAIITPCPCSQPIKVELKF